MKPNSEFDNWEEDDSWLSVCCTAHALYELQIDAFDDDIEPTGICSHCKDHCTFERLEDEDNEFRVLGR